MLEQSVPGGTKQSHPPRCEKPPVMLLSRRIARRLLSDYDQGTAVLDTHGPGKALTVLMMELDTETV